MDAGLTYTFAGGQHPETAAYRALLAHAGVHDAAGNPLSEAMVLGVGGGLGMGYILWEFKEHSMRTLVLGMRNRWQYAASLPDKLAERLGVRFAVAETGGAKGAQAALDATLALGRPALLWVDPAHLPYLGLPSTADGCGGHTIVVYGQAGAEYLVDDRALQPFSITGDELAAARGRIGSYKHRLVSVEAINPAGAVDLRAAIRAGLADCAAHLALRSDSFSLPAIRKWARMTTDTRNAKGWPNVFADRLGIFSLLLSIFEGVTDYGTGGGSLRPLYAVFLDEAAAKLGAPALADVAQHYKMLGMRWANLGEMAMPTDVPAMRQAKELVARRSALAMAMGEGSVRETAVLDSERERLRTAADREFPMDEAATHALFAALGAELEAIYTDEVSANRMLRAALDA